MARWRRALYLHSVIVVVLSSHVSCKGQTVYAGIEVKDVFGGI